MTWRGSAPRRMPWLAVMAIAAFGNVEAAAQAGSNRIVLIGSSIAAGVGASVYDSAWAGRYGKHLAGLDPAWAFTSLAVPGYTTFNCMPTGFKTPTGRPGVDTAHNLTKALSLHPQVLLISLTGNDIANGYPAKEYEDNFDSLRAIATRAGITVWITTPTPRTAVDSTKRKAIIALRSWMQGRYKPRLIEFYDSLNTEDAQILKKYDSGDGIHPNNLGHALLFRRVVAAKLNVTTAIRLAPARASARNASGLGLEGGRVLAVDPAADMLGRSAAHRNLEVTPWQR